MFSAVALQHDRGWTSISLATRACSRIQSTILTNHSYYPPPQFSTIFSILRYSINNNADQRLVLPSTIQFWSVTSFFLHSKGALRDNHTGERGVNYGKMVVCVQPFAKAKPPVDRSQQTRHHCCVGTTFANNHCSTLFYQHFLASARIWIHLFPWKSAFAICFA